MSLRRKLMSSFLVLIIIIVAIGYVNIQASKSVADSFNHVTQVIFPETAMLWQIEVASSRIAREALATTSLDTQPEESDSGDIQDKEEFQAAKANLSGLMAQWGRVTEPPETIQSVTDRVTAVLNASEALVDLQAEAGDQEEIASARLNLEKAQDQLTERLQELQAVETAGLDEAHEQGVQNSQLAQALNLVSLLTISVAAVLIGYFLTRSITNPITNLKNAALAIAAGNFNTRIATTSRDEIGTLAATFNQMAETVEKRDASLTNYTHQLEKANALAKESVRLKSEFLSTMSHELRTPLNAITGFCGILLEGMGGEFDQDVRHMLDRIQSNSERLLTLINQVLDLARIEADRLELVSIPLSVHDLAEGWHSQIQVLAEKKGLAFALEIDPTLPEILKGDPERLTQIATNLLSNAVKFTNSGSIKLSLKRHDTTWVIQVSDTGIGIPPHALNYIFDEFRQLDGSSTRVYGGSGLGLAIVRKLCLMMHGSVQVSSGLGKGSVFTVTLPLETAPTSQPLVLATA